MFNPSAPPRRNTTTSARGLSPLPVMNWLSPAISAPLERRRRQSQSQARAGLLAGGGLLRGGDAAEQTPQNAVVATRALAQRSGIDARLIDPAFGQRERKMPAPQQRA